MQGLDIRVIISDEDANKKLKAEKGIATDEVTDASDIN